MSNAPYNTPLTEDRAETRADAEPETRDPAASDRETRRGDAAEPAAETLFESASVTETEKLVLAIGGYEGPLDVLLDLARRQKVDLREISVLELAEQYLRFIAEAKRLRLDLAAEYLVMAAWLAYLKSRMLLPKPPEDEEPSDAEMAAHLAFRLERLQGMRDAAEALFALPQLGQHFFGRGEPERRKISTRVEWVATQHELLLAYARQRTKESFQPLHLERRAVVAIDEALLRLRNALEAAGLAAGIDWERIESFLPEEWRDDDHARSAVSSTFAAMLELAKHGRLKIRQDEIFGPIFVTPNESGGERMLTPGSLFPALEATAGQSPGQSPGQDTGQDTGHDAGRDPKPAPTREPSQEPSARDAARDPADKSRPPARRRGSAA